MFVVRVGMFPAILILIGLALFLLGLVAGLLEWASVESALAIASTGALIVVIGNILNTRK
ncbi:MAG: hypothetical protein ACFE68_01775 [Candidatus Hodarchaeota archaeon]